MTTVAGAAFRGQPLVLLAVVLCGWGVLRAAFWETPFGPAAEIGRMAARPLIARSEPPLLETSPEVAAGAVASSVGKSGEAPVSLTMAGPEVEPPPSPPVPEDGEASAPALVQLPIGSNLFLAAGLARMDVSAALAEHLRLAAPSFPAGTADLPLGAGARNRWSADGWVLVRAGDRLAPGPLRPNYGRSQAGAIIRYHLGAEQAHAAQIHARVSTALAGETERELAAGLSARPVAGAPLRVTAELRAADTPRGARARAAIFANTELAPVVLPLETQAEFYLQGGYVGGEFPTAFADGQARLDRPLAGQGDIALWSGIAAWGGVQRGAGRLDIGPSASLRFPIGGGYARLSADYRIRLAGGAMPTSGPALALSAGF